MECSKAWELIMKYFDKEITDVKDIKLEEHLKLCESCRIKFNSLEETFSEMDKFCDQAPSNIEAMVLKKLKFSRNQDQITMPFLIAPIIIFLSVLAYGFYQVQATGPISFLNELLELFSMAYRFSNTIYDILKIIFSTFYLKQVVVFVFAIGLFYITNYMVMRWRKVNNK